MKRTAILKVVNPILGLLVVSQLLSGLFGEALLHEVFEVIHQGGGILIAITASLHLLLNWNWVKANYFRKAQEA